MLFHIQFTDELIDELIKFTAEFHLQNSMLNWFHID
jgi:hypothetical protein